MILQNLALFSMMVFIGGSGLALAQDSTPEPGASRIDSYGLEQVWIPAGCFMMGSDDPEGFAGLEPPAWVQRAREPAMEQPAHEVCITKGYWIDKYEVTNAAYQAFIDDGGYDTQAYWSEKGWTWREANLSQTLPAECIEIVPENPRVCVTWYEAEAYAHWRGGRLPSEAEWEYAARGPESLIFPWGNEWDASKANVIESSGSVAVGSYPDGASWVGALDMAGNAMEWVNDWLGRRYYESSPKDDPQGPDTGSNKVEKGGWWGSDPFVARSAYRHYEDPPTYQDHHIGFRVVTDEVQ